jgi:hypothetical protein
MGTRGHLVFCWHGRKIIIYNHWDSYPSCMGAEIFLQLVKLMQRFLGDVRNACQHWKTLASNLSLNYSQGVSSCHPFNTMHAFDAIEESLHVSLPLCVECEDICDEWIEYVWTIDLQKGRLTMHTNEGMAEWSFLGIYRGIDFLDLWVNEAEEAASSGSTLQRQPFTTAILHTAAVTIQASARRFLEMSRALRPDGLLARMAAKRFRRACEFQRGRTM